MRIIALRGFQYKTSCTGALNECAKKTIVQVAGILWLVVSSRVFEG
ncbi:MAG: hypothetical protein HOO97_11675 [Sideroxydans sp.]|nr:hypothetical protein [Sideroxydans sp.]